MDNYDIVIIGGGIAGIYTMYNIIKKYPKKKVLLLEKNNRFGGRIYTYHEKIDNINFSINLGAGRLGYHHKLIIDLINELNLNKKIIPITNFKDYYEINNNTGINKTNYRNEIIKKKLNFINSTKINKLSKSFLQKHTFNEIVKKYLSK